MEVNGKLEEKLDGFSKIVQEEFGFLVDDYGFIKKELEKLDFEYPKDKHVRIEYTNEFLCIQIDWYLADVAIGIGLIELENGKMPSKYSYWEKEGFSRAISLSTLIEFITKGELKDPLPRVGARASGRKMMRARREREKLIDQDMRGVLATYSSWLRDYAGDVLRGDTSIFESVWTYAKEKIVKEYYP